MRRRPGDDGVYYFQEALAGRHLFIDMRLMGPLPALDDGKPVCISMLEQI